MPPARCHSAQRYVVIPPQAIAASKKQIQLGMSAINIREPWIASHLCVRSRECFDGP